MTFTTTNPITLDHIVILNDAIATGRIRLWVFESGYISGHAMGSQGFNFCYLADLVEVGAIVLSEKQDSHLPHVIEFEVTEAGQAMVRDRQYSEFRYPGGVDRGTFGRYIYSRLSGWTMPPSVDLSRLGLRQ